MAVVVGMDGRPTPVHEEFEVADLDRDDIRRLMERMEKALIDSGEARRNVILAALAELSTRYLDTDRVRETAVASKRARTGS